MLEARIGWRTDSSGVKWVIDMNKPEWKSFVRLDPNAELTHVEASVFTSGVAYHKSDRAVMPSSYPVMGSGTIRIETDKQNAEVALAVFHDRNDGHWNLLANGRTAEDEPVSRKNIEGHQLDDTKDIELIVRVDNEEKRVTIKPEKDFSLDLYPETTV